LIHRYIEAFVLCPNCRLVSHHEGIRVFKWLTGLPSLSKIWFGFSSPFSNSSSHTFSPRRITRLKVERSITNVWHVARKRWSTWTTSLPITS
jgi:hypothetical protein